MEQNPTNFGGNLKIIMDYASKNDLIIIEKIKKSKGYVYNIDTSKLKIYLKSKNLFDEDVC